MNSEKIGNKRFALVQEAVCKHVPKLCAYSHSYACIYVSIRHICAYIGTHTRVCLSGCIRVYACAYRQAYTCMRYA